MIRASGCQTKGWEGGNLFCTPIEQETRLTHNVLGMAGLSRLTSTVTSPGEQPPSRSSLDPRARGEIFPELVPERELGTVPGAVVGLPLARRREEPMSTPLRPTDHTWQSSGAAAGASPILRTS